MSVKDLRKRCDELFAEMEQTCSVIERVKFGEYFELRGQLLKEMEDGRSDLRKQLEEAQAAVAEMTELLRQVPSPPFPWRRETDDYQRWDEGQKRALANQAGRTFLDEKRKLEKQLEDTDRGLENCTKHSLHSVNRILTLEKRTEEAQAEAAAMQEALRYVDGLTIAISAAGAILIETALRSDAGRAFHDRLRKAEERAEKAEKEVRALPEADLVDPAQLLEAIADTQTPLQDGEELHEWVERNEDEWTKTLAKQAALTEKAEERAEKSESDRAWAWKQYQEANECHEKAMKRGETAIEDRDAARRERDDARTARDVACENRDESQARVKELEAEVDRLDKECIELIENKDAMETVIANLKSGKGPINARDKVELRGLTRVSRFRKRQLYEIHQICAEEGIPTVLASGANTAHCRVQALVKKLKAEVARLNTENEALVTMNAQPDPVLHEVSEEEKERFRAEVRNFKAEQAIITGEAREFLMENVPDESFDTNGVCAAVIDAVEHIRDEDMLQSVYNLLADRRRIIEHARRELDRLKHQPSGEPLPILLCLVCASKLRWKKELAAWYCSRCEKTLDFLCGMVSVSDKAVPLPEYATKAEVRRLAYIMTHLCRERGPYLDGSDPNKGLWDELRKLAEDDPPTRDDVPPVKGAEGESSRDLPEDPFDLVGPPHGGGPGG